MAAAWLHLTNQPMTAPRQLNIHDKIRAAVTAILRSHLEIDLSYLDRWDLAEKSTNCVAGSRAEVVHRIGRFQHLLKTGISVNTVKAYFQWFCQFQQMLKSGQTQAGSVAIWFFSMALELYPWPVPQNSTIITWGSQASRTTTSCSRAPICRLTFLLLAKCSRATPGY